MRYLTSQTLPTTMYNTASRKGKVYAKTYRLKVLLINTTQELKYVTPCVEG